MFKGCGRREEVTKSSRRWMTLRSYRGVTGPWNSRKQAIRSLFDIEDSARFVEEAMEVLRILRM
jgi:hypothetical protein